MRAAAFALVFLAAGPAAAACVPGPERLVGHYWLEGQMEVGAELILAADGRFEFALAYGANDQYGRGCWSLRDKAVTLMVEGRRSVPRRASPDDRRFRGMVLIDAGRGVLRWPLPGFRGVFRKAGG